MVSQNKFKTRLQCICNNSVVFEIIENVECDWGEHSVIQCPKCEELYSIDKQCPAFQNIFELEKNNPGLYSKQEISDYLSQSHPD